MWQRWSLRTKIVVLTVAVVLPILAAATSLTIRMSHAALEDDLRDSGLVLARGLAVSAVSIQDVEDALELRREISSLVGKGSVVRDVAVYRLTPDGLAVRATSSAATRPGPEEEIAARENQEVLASRIQDGHHILRVAIPIRDRGRTVGVVSLGLPLDRADALAQRARRQVFSLGLGSVILIVGSLSMFMNRALTMPLGHILRVMGRAEGGNLTARAPEDRQDEVGQVARGLNRMLDRVGSFQAELAQRVAEATVELRATNQRLYAAQQQVARNERLAAAGELAAAMAHDVGTPLTGVSGNLQLLEEEVADPAVNERLRTIQAQVDRAVSAARRFLDAARPEPSRVPVDVKALLEDLLVLTSPEAQRKGITVLPRLAEGLPPLAADPNQMQELFLNLIANALDSMGPGGTLRLLAEPMRDHDDPAGVRVTVEDTGPGMVPEVLARAFEPFFTTRGPQGGTGLGLAICRRIASEHGGTVLLESEPGHGTRAIVELPVRAGEGS